MASNTKKQVFIASPSGLFNPYTKEVYPCALGKAGLTHIKQEGDSKSPICKMSIEMIFYRADKIKSPTSSFPLHEIKVSDGWCDEPTDPHYNQHISLPYSASHETLWREDHLYDIILVLNYNRHPVIPRKGSAIFMHIAKPDYSGTEGCIAVSHAHMLDFLNYVTPKDVIEIAESF